MTKIPDRIHRHRPLQILLCASAALLAGNGCNVIGAAVYKFSPPPEIPAKFTLQNRPTLVLVENYRNPDLSAVESELLARYLQEKFVKQKLVTIVKSEKVLDLRNLRPKDFGRMTIPQIGQAVGAEQVIYVDLQAAAVGAMAANVMLQGKAAGAVKVIDCKTGDSLWPPENADGYPVAYETPPIKGSESGTYSGVRDQLFDGFADKITKLFYKWRMEETPGGPRARTE